MPFIPFTAHTTFHKKYAEQARKKKEEEATARRRRATEKEKETKAAAVEAAGEIERAKAVSSPAISSRQKLINELTEKFGEPIVSQIKWNAMTPPTTQCHYLKEQEKTKTKIKTSPNKWSPEFGGGGKRKTRKSKKSSSHKNKKSSSCKNKKYFFW